MADGAEGEGGGGVRRVPPPVELELSGGALTVRMDGRYQWDLIGRGPVSL